MIKLTLRTLLAYLDDTLEPAEIKHIGQKIKESPHAQELIARIQKVVRRRRITAPPPHGATDRFDANYIADYLDNELTADEVTALENFCLEDHPEADACLAEVAACHQLLTLVQGQAGSVPPIAKERMYALVEQGQSPVPRPAAAPRPARAARPEVEKVDAFAHEEDSPILSLSSRGRAWVAWLLPLAGIFLLVAAGLAIYFALPDDTPTNPPVTDGSLAQNDLGKQKQPGPEPAPKDDTGKDGAGKDGLPKKDMGKDTGKTVEDPPTPPMPPPDPTPMDPVTPPPPPPTPFQRPGPPSDARAKVANYRVTADQPSILVQKTEQSWRRVVPNAEVSSVDRLVSLPGYPSELRTADDVRMLLRGQLPQFDLDRIMFFQLDSAVTLHESKDFDLDFTLHRGRVYLTNHKTSGEAKIRLRFHEAAAPAEGEPAEGEPAEKPQGPKEVWDITLKEPQSEVMVELVSHYFPGINYLDGEEPLSILSLCLLEGKAGVRIDTFDYPSLEPPAGQGVLFIWNNKGPRSFQPMVIPETPTIWSKSPPAGPRTRRPGEVPPPDDGDPTARSTLAQMQAAIGELSNLVDDRPVSLVLKEVVTNPECPPARKELAIYAMAAIDEVRHLVDVLGADGTAAHKERDFAAYALRRWLDRSPQASKQLYDAKTKQGVLVDKGYAIGDAEITLALLHDLADARTEATDQEARLDALLLYLAHDRPAIRHLAHNVLVRSTPHVQEMDRPAFNAGWPPGQREKAINEWRMALMKREKQ